MAGKLELTVTSPLQSLSEPLTRTEVETYIGLTSPSPADSGYQEELDLFISAAREQAELLQGRDLVEKQYDLWLDYFHSHVIELRNPLAAVDLFRYRDSGGSYTSMVEGSDFIVDLVRGTVQPPYNQTWPTFTPWPSSAIQIRFTVAAPSYLRQTLKVGMLQLISDWYNDRLPFAVGVDAAEGYPRRLRMLLAAGGESLVG